MNAVFKFLVVSVFLVPNYRPLGLLNSSENKALRKKRISLLCTTWLSFSLQEIPVSVNQSRISLVAGGKVSVSNVSAEELRSRVENKEKPLKREQSSGR